MKDDAAHDESTPVTPKPRMRWRIRRFVVGHDERGDDGAWRSVDAPRLSVAVSRFAQAQGLAVQTLFGRMRAGIPAAVALTIDKDSSPE